MVGFFNVWSSLDVRLEQYFFQRFRISPNCSAASLGEQEALPYVLKVSVASGIALKILGYAVKRFYRAVGKAGCILTILAVFLDHDEGVDDLIKVFFQGVSNVLVEDLESVK